MSARRPSASRKPPAHAAAQVPWFGPNWELCNETAAALWRGMEVGVDVQQQCLQRWALRQQEWLRHGHAPGTAAWLDLALAGMRWTLQEWQQTWQDMMAAPLVLRGDLRQDQALLHRHGGVPDEPADPWLELLARMGAQQMQAWVDLWACAGRQRMR